MLASLDQHDILVLIDGRPELPQEVSSETPDLRTYITAELAVLRTPPRRVGPR